MTSWIVDTSVWSRIASDPVVSARVDELVADPASVLLTCPPQVLEYCYMARSAAEFRDLEADMQMLVPARYHPAIEDVSRIQEALFAAGMGRAAGPVDILTAAYARLNDAVVLAADRDYESIARVTPGLAIEYIRPAS